jgi:hypothetical protein
MITRAGALALLALLGACDDGDAPPSPERTDAASDARTDVVSSEVGDAGATDATTDVGSEAPVATRTPGVVILSSDRKSTSISIGAIEGTGLVNNNCLHSGSASPKLSAALSGDVVLPSAPQPSHEIALVDRENSTITWAAPDTCEVLRQMNVGTGFAANPYDLIGAPGDKGYVPRYKSNPGNPAEGSDVLVINTATATVTGRIDLRASAGPSAAPAMPVLPFPTRGVLAGGKVYIALNNFSVDYSVAGPGRLVVIDPATDTVTGTIDLGGLKNCGAVDLAAGPNGPALAVGCNGPFSDGPAQIDSAGIAWVDLSVSPPAVTVVKAAPFARPVSGFEVAALDPSFGATVVPGDFGMPPNDAVFVFDFTGGAPRKLYEGSTSFSLSIGFDHQRQLLYVLDATMNAPRVHVYRLPIAAGAQPSVSYLSNLVGLPPRQIQLY